MCVDVYSASTTAVFHHPMSDDDFKIFKVCTRCFLQNSPTLLQSRICSIQCKQLHLMTRVGHGKALSYGLYRQLLPHRGEMMLYMRLLCSKKHELSWEKMPLVCMDYGHGGVCVLLSPGICSASPPCHAHLVKLTFSWLLCPREQKFL